jgi:hypothetical protein
MCARLTQRIHTEGVFLRQQSRQAKLQLDPAFLITFHFKNGILHPPAVILQQLEDPISPAVIDNIITNHPFHVTASYPHLARKG